MNNLQTIPAKPIGVKWTDAQWQAIHASGSDMLVAAAAGSGKTAVLVERIIARITSPTHPVDIDRLLILTFTNAAAGEMRNRISAALEKEIEQHPDDIHLRRQLSLAGKAQISTLHAFCIEIVRSHFFLLGIDPGFALPSDTERSLLMDEALTELLEEEYAQPDNTAFFNLVDALVSDRSDEELLRMILRVYEASRSHPDPNAWLLQLERKVQIPLRANVEALEFYPHLIQDVHLELEAALEKVKLGRQICDWFMGPIALRETFDADIYELEAALTKCNEGWEAARQAVLGIVFTRAAIVKKEDADESLKKRATDLRIAAKKQVARLIERYFARETEDYLNDIRAMAPYTQKLAALVKRFDEIFLSIKKQKNLLDFNDVEHLALTVLADNTVAAEYQERFLEVMIDEYQDTNQVQEALVKRIAKASEREGNLFMVGDVKQSIYRFRLADPTLFMGKYEKFTHEPSESGLRIDLNQNFRSRAEVLAGTNFLFKQIMNYAIGQIDYDHEAALYLGADYPQESAYPIEVHLLDEKVEEEKQPSDADSEELVRASFEAHKMATVIEQLFADGQQVYDVKSGTYRPLAYRDIVILQSTRTWYPEIIDVFRERGIPVYGETNAGYFETTEMGVIISLLQMIDNPYQDIPLAAVLRSPIVGLQEEDLAKIRMQQKRGTFYDAVKKSAFTSERLHRFLQRLQKWRSDARQEPIAHLIWQIYRETGFLDYVTGMPGGKQRRANLIALYHRAAEYESAASHHLFRFLRFIDRLRERGDDLGEAAAIAEQEDVVRLMTIHGSKGLEFPVVLLGGLGRQFNQMDSHGSYMIDKDLGLAMKYVNPNERIMRDTFMRQAIQNKSMLEDIAEQMRVLYVAMTRAKERLFLFATVADLEKEVQQWSTQLSNPNWLLSAYVRAKAKSFLDWIGPALLRHADAKSLLDEQVIGEEIIPFEIITHPSKWSISLTKKADLVFQQQPKEEQLDARFERIRQFKLVESGTSKRDEITTRMNWSYAFQQPTQTKAKQSVTELKKMSLDKDEAAAEEFKPKTYELRLERPQFLQDKEISAAERGTLMHLAMEHFDLHQPISLKTITEKLDELVRKEYMTAVERTAITSEQILAFFQSEIGKRVIAAEMVWREQPFSVMIPATEIYSDWQGGEEQILVQGVIDCMFETENGEMVLVDYKTDRITPDFETMKPELQRRYQKQIELYTKAIETITHKKVIEKVLYFFDNGGHVLSL